VSKLPATSFVCHDDTHRLISSQCSNPGDSVLTRLTDDGAVLANFFEIEGGTNDRLLAESELLPGVGIHELVFRIPFASIINAAFTHAHPLGSRFNGPDRGAWYASFEIETAQAEVAFHRTIDLAEVERFEDDVTYDDYLADFKSESHDLRNAAAFTRCLYPDSYVESQGLAEHLLDVGSMGIVYTSVRRPSDSCLACFRPALVTNVRKSNTFRFVWDGKPEPVIINLSGC
jgi:RES domain